MQIVRAGDNALLVELGEVTAGELHTAAASVRRVERVLACLPGHSSLYVVCDGEPDEEQIGRAALERKPGNSINGRIHRLRVSFASGYAPDLDEFLSQVSFSKDAFLQRVATLRLTARYLGFRGGFAYLDGWPDEWSMPRRATSRPRVARGTFGVAGSTAGFYPIESPGGWNLLGRTDVDLEHAIEAGDVIELIPTLETLPPSPEVKRQELSLPWADVLAAPLARVVSAADWSLTLRGSAPGGPFDPLAAALANHAVGRGEQETLLECAVAGPRLRFRESGFVAWCEPDLQLEVRTVREGETIAWGPLRNGLRGYLAFGTETGSRMPAITREDRLTIRTLSGPHDSGLSTVACVVTPQLDRVGIRLTPLEPLGLNPTAALASCGMQCGTIQLHPDGSLVAMGPDHPVTGGYLQPMTVITSERWKLGQLVPGDRVTFLVESQLPN
ncbi:MAG TPA: carboxyltransferase domain-containing protein [Thermoanaerobaculia bacterium]